MSIRPVRKFLDIAASPLSRHLQWFGLLTLLMVAPQLVLWYATQGGMMSAGQIAVLALYKLSMAVILCWIPLMIYDIMPSRWLRCVFITIVIGLISLGTILDCYTLITYDCEFRNDYLGVLVASNGKEIYEFVTDTLSSRFTLYLVIIAISITASYLIIRRLLRNLHINRRYSFIILAISLLTNAALTALKPVYPHIYAPIYIKAALTPSIWEKTDLPLHHAKIERTDNLPLPNVVVVIGESLCRDFLGIYGYGLDTTPEMQKLVNDSLLIPYSEVVAPHTHTVECFQRFMGEYRGEENGDNRDWRECYNIVDLATDLGYHTAWVSNQSKHGIYDNLVTSFSRNCHTAMFTEESLTHYFNNRTFDEAVLPLIDSIGLGQKPLFTFVHLMGNHILFENRYPADEAYFGREMYKDYIEFQQPYRMHYDNATRYNDKVVSSIMRRFDNRQAIVIYFADHGLDLFHSYPTSHGHANSPHTDAGCYARKIPFVVYTTPPLRQSRPDIVDRVKAAADKPMDTTDLIYYLTQILGIKYERH